MTEYSRMAKGSFTSTGSPKVINLPFQPDSVEFWNYTAAGAALATDVPYAYWDASMGQGKATAQYFAAGPVLTTGNVSSNGISTFSAGQALQYGPAIAVTAISKASQGQATVTSTASLSAGDVVIFEGTWQTTTTGMPQMDGIPVSIVSIDSSTQFTFNWNTNQTNYTAISLGGTGFVKVKKVLYPFIYFPGVCVINSITTGTNTTINTASAHNYQVGQEVAFRIPNDYGTVELNSLPNTLTPGSPQYGYVTSVTNAFQFVVNIDSTNYTAYTHNIPITNVSGLDFPQVVAVGDVNTGGILISGGRALYPPPYYTPLSATVETINGPAIRGAFVNNTAQGFIIGSGLVANVANTFLVGEANDVIYWRAYLCDMTVV